MLCARGDRNTNNPQAPQDKWEKGEGRCTIRCARRNVGALEHLHHSLLSPRAMKDRGLRWALSTDGSRCWGDFLPNEAVKGCHAALEKPFQLVARLFRQVLDLGGHSCKAFGLGRRSHGNAKMSPELKRRPQRIALHDIGFHRDRCPTELIEQRPRSGMIRGVDLGLIPRV